MLTLSTTQLWVHDQDEALAFWTAKVGFEVKEDVTVPEMGNFRWLTVSPKGQDCCSIALMANPGAPVLDDATRDQVKDLMASGFAGAIFFTTQDAYATYDALVARGVEVIDKRTEQPYGIDFGFRDPPGNTVRVTQRIATR
jgi:uncharacterized glyoxalase superfamily protein PhnB